MERAEALAAWKARVRQNWPQIQIQAASAVPDKQLQVGDALDVRVSIRLGDLNPDDVTVEVYVGRVDANGEIVKAEATPLEPIETDTEGGYVFEASAIPCRRSGLHGYTIRVLPHHPDLVTSFLPGLILWAGAVAK